MHTLVVKIQRPLASSDALEATPWLVKTQDGRFEMFCPPTEQMVEHMAGKAKFYARVTIAHDALVILEVLPAQPW